LENDNKKIILYYEDVHEPICQKEKLEENN